MGASGRARTSGAYNEPEPLYLPGGAARELLRPTWPGGRVSGGPRSPEIVVGCGIRSCLLGSAVVRRTWGRRVGVPVQFESINHCHSETWAARSCDREAEIRPKKASNASRMTGFGIPGCRPGCRPLAATPPSASTINGGRQPTVPATCDCESRTGKNCPSRRGSAAPRLINFTTNSRATSWPSLSFCRPTRTHSWPYPGASGRGQVRLRFERPHSHPRMFGWRRAGGGRVQFSQLRVR
jgi:hypothetical protein